MRYRQLLRARSPRRKCLTRSSTRAPRRQRLAPAREPPAKWCVECRVLAWLNGWSESNTASDASRLQTLTATSAIGERLRRKAVMSGLSSSSPDFPRNSHSRAHPAPRPCVAQCHICAIVGERSYMAQREFGSYAQDCPAIAPQRMWEVVSSHRYP